MGTAGILLLTPLTKEAVATNNNGCHQQANYHSNGFGIQMVDTFESFWNDRKRRNHNKRRRREEAARKGLQ